jgi:hypothetical protein
MRLARDLRDPESFLMMDIVYVALTAGLFVVSWGLVRLCDVV